VVVAIIMEAVVSSCAHIEASMVPMSVSFTDPNSDASDPNIDVFRDDNWFVADVQRTGKRRHCQERNKKKSKHSTLHDILPRVWDTCRPHTSQNARSVFPKSV
jgi:hypothetical protein